MSAIVVCPLARVAETAVRYKCREMVTLLARGQSFHRPAVIAAERHLILEMNDIAFDAQATDALIAPGEAHVGRLIDFVRQWDRQAPLLIHCWMGVSRSPAAALVAALALAPHEDEAALTARLRAASPFATPNTRIVAIGDRMLERRGRLTAAVKAIGRGTECNGGLPFQLPLNAEYRSPGFDHFARSSPSRASG